MTTKFNLGAKIDSVLNVSKITKFKTFVGISMKLMRCSKSDRKCGSNKTSRDCIRSPTKEKSFLSDNVLSQHKHFFVGVS